ncbi:helix-turn-helix transcriptional regulator [Arabiibacter massiliensis]|uniref:helix-turn-helix transcriptional regulator n=1 Tax=Arabiibacter massiliensis TaxID=1870985 RepID=UPI0009BBA1AA|nr:helix-turn-helix transcriptional regulator [Arabiibacter massiliensis]
MGQLREALGMERTRDAVFFGGYALYLVFSYIAFHSFTIFAPADALDPASQTLFLATVLVARIAVFAAIAFCSLKSSGPQTVVSVLAACGIALFGFLVCGMALQFAHDVDFSRILPWLLFGGVCLGAGDAVMVLLWARFCKTLTLRAVYLYVLVCNVLSLVVYFGMTFLPPEVIVPATAVVFVASSVFVKRSLDIRARIDSEYSRPVMRSAATRLWRPVFGTAVFCFMSGLMMQISGQQQLPLSTVQQTSIVTSAVVVALLLLPALFMKKPFNIGRLYKMALPLSAAGFLLLPLLWNAAGGIVNAFAQLGSMVASIILWCMLADMARDTRLPSALVFSTALACTNGAQLAGILVGFFNASRFTAGSLTLTVVALVSLYLLSMLSLVLFRDKDPGADEAAAPAPQVVVREEQWFAERCAFLAREHQLTAREAEIFALLAQGRTVHGISEKLFVSENTVKSHIKSIYQKLGIHVRAELIELVNEGEA